MLKLASAVQVRIGVAFAVLFTDLQQDSGIAYSVEA